MLKRYLQSPKLRKAFFIFLGIFFVFLIAGDVYFSKANVIESYVRARQKSDLDMEDLKPYLVWADTKEYVTFEEAKYARFKPLTAEQADNLKRQLKSATEQDDLYVTSIGKRLWLFSDYRIAMKPLQLTVKTNLPQMDLLLNQKKVAVTDSEDFSFTLERLPIADYEATLAGNYQKKRLEFSKSYDGQNPVIDLMVTFKSFELVSNLTDGEVMIGKDRFGTLKEGQYQFDNFPMTEDLPVFVQKSFADGDIKSKEVSLAQIENGTTLRLDIDNLLGEEQAGSLLVAAFEQFASYLASRQDPTDLSLFESGKTNGFYRALKDSVQARLLTDARRASYMTIPNIWLNSMRQVGKESYALEYSAVYSYYYDKETDPQKKTQGTFNQTITGVATLKKSGDGYIFQSTGNSGVQVVKEEDKVKPLSIFPEGLIGTWETRLDKEKARVSVTFFEDGRVSKTIDYDGPTPDKTYTARVEETVEVGGGVYRYVGVSGDMEALLVRAGLGGAGVQYEHGIQLKGSSVTPLVWEIGGGQADYQKALSSGSLSKK